MQVMKMYRHEVYDQLKMEMPFGVTLREDNRWVILSKKFPWEEIDREYQEHFKSSEGQVAIPSRLAFGTLYIQAEEGYTDEQTRRNIQENPYLQYFCGFECYTMESPFDASMMTHFRKRISPEMIQRINDLVFAPEAVASTDNPEEDDSVNQEDSEDPLSAQPTEKSENRGTLILDATCCPADIHYPTDVGLLNHARELRLRTDEKSTKIALKAGFNDISYFNRAFAAAVGMTPREYRSQGSGRGGPEGTPTELSTEERAV